MTTAENIARVASDVRSGVFGEELEWMLTPEEIEKARHAALRGDRKTLEELGVISPLASSGHVAQTAGLKKKTKEEEDALNPLLRAGKYGVPAGRYIQSDRLRDRMNNGGISILPDAPDFDRDRKRDKDRDKDAHPKKHKKDDKDRVVDLDKKRAEIDAHHKPKKPTTLSRETAERLHDVYPSHKITKLPEPPSPKTAHLVKKAEKSIVKHASHEAGEKLAQKGLKATAKKLAIRGGKYIPIVGGAAAIAGTAYLVHNRLQSGEVVAAGAEVASGILASTVIGAPVALAIDGGLLLYDSGILGQVAQTAKSEVKKMIKNPSAYAKLTVDRFRDTAGTIKMAAGMIAKAPVGMVASVAGTVGKGGYDLGKDMVKGTVNQIHATAKDVWDKGLLKTAGSFFRGVSQDVKICLGYGKTTANEMKDRMAANKKAISIDEKRRDPSRIASEHSLGDANDLNRSKDRGISMAG